MNLRYYSKIGATALFFAGAALMPISSALAAQQGVEELTRGPVHEAFAEASSYDPEPGLIVKIAPPRMIEEVPPDQQPAGDNVTWIPGYWGWDEEQSDFIWISGIWRNLPPGRQWVPGYWANTGSQWQWTSGYWAADENQEVTYYSKPPKSIESGPNVAAPSDNDIWIPGNWIYREDRYAWRPGYWEPAQEDWTWMPAHYQWTRRGYIYVEGYWDYNVVRRGMVFAPVRFEREVYDRPDYYYTPVTVIAINVFVNHLFIRPNYGHYYFGDYYAPRYRNEGFYASFSYHSDRHGYDPIYAHSRWEHRQDRDWDRKRRDDFDFYRDNESARPPRTVAALFARPDGDRRGKRDNFEFAEPLNRYVSERNRDNDGRQRFQAVDKGERDRLVQQRQDMRKFGDERQRLENRDGQGPKESSGKDKLAQAVREKFLPSPVASKRADQLKGKDAPPSPRESRGPNDRGPRGPETPLADGKKGPDTRVNPSEPPTPPRGMDRNGDGKPDQPGTPEKTLPVPQNGPGDKRQPKDGPAPERNRETPRTNPETLPDRKGPPEGGNPPKAPDITKKPDDSQRVRPEKSEPPATVPTPAPRERLDPKKLEPRKVEPGPDVRPKIQPVPTKPDEPVKRPEIPQRREQKAPAVPQTPTPAPRPQREIQPEPKAPQRQQEKPQQPRQQPIPQPQRQSQPPAPQPTRQQAAPQQPRQAPAPQQPKAAPTPRENPAQGGGGDGGKGRRGRD